MDRYTHRIGRLDWQLDVTSVARGTSLHAQRVVVEAEKRAAMLRGDYALAAEYEYRLSTARAQLAVVEDEERRARERSALAATGRLPWDALGIGVSALSAYATGSPSLAAYHLIDHYPFLSASQYGLGWPNSSPAIARALQEAEERRRREAEASRYWDEARRLSEMAAGFSTGSFLSGFKVEPQSLAERIALGGAEAFQGHWADPLVAEGLARASAFSNMLTLTGRVDEEVMRAAGEFREIGLPGVTDTALARAMLNAGGLPLRPFDEWLFPSRRILRLPPTKGQKRRALNKVKKEKAPTTLHLRATRAIGAAEGLVREVIQAAMQLVYGDAWEDDRLPLCDCKGLLGKVKKRGGTAMDHADWADYERIMCHHEHFAAIFWIGFSDVSVLQQAVEAVRKDRVPVAHYKTFNANSLSALRASCRTLEDGLMELLHPLGLMAEDNEQDDAQQG